MSSRYPQIKNNEQVLKIVTFDVFRPIYCLRRLINACSKAEWKFNRWQITEPRAGWQVNRPRLSPGRLQTNPRRDDVEFSLGENPYFSVLPNGDVYLSAPIDREETPFIRYYGLF